MKSIVLGLLRAGVGIALLAWVLSDAETRAATADLFTVGWLLPCTVALIAGGGSIEALRLQLLFRSQKLTLSWIDAYRVILIGTFFNSCLPGGTGGDVMKLYYLAKGNAGRRVEILTLLVADRFVALTSVLLVILVVGLSSAGLLAEHAEIRAFVWAAAGMLGLGALGVAIALSRGVRETRIFQRTLDVVPLGRYVRRGIDALHAFREHVGSLVLAFGISLVGHCLLITLIVLAGQAVMPEVPALPLVLLTLLGMLANVLPITPGGLGVGEAAIDGLFELVGYGPGSPILLAWRISQLPLMALGALLYVVGKRDAVAHADQPMDARET